MIRDQGSANFWDQGSGFTWYMGSGIITVFLGIRDQDVSWRIGITTAGIVIMMKQSVTTQHCKILGDQG